jgi:hypothetical protein
MSLISCIALFDLVGHTEGQANATILHSYRSEQGQEVINIIPVEQEKLYSLLPQGYQIVPAASLGFGGADQGIVAITNFRGFGSTVDGKETNLTQVSISVSIVIAEPSDAAKVGLDIPGAPHVYTLQIYTNDAQYAASLQSGGMPVEFVEDIEYERNMDDASGVGNLFVNVPANDSPLMTLSSGQGYFPVPGALNGVFWADREDKDKVALHFLDEPFRQGNAIGQILTQSQTRWNTLFDGGGLGSCPTVPEPGYDCIIAPSLNLRFDGGTRGELILVDSTSVPEPTTTLPFLILGAGGMVGSIVRRL